jgi:hypothetical protein
MEISFIEEKTDIACERKTSCRFEHLKRNSLEKDETFRMIFLKSEF